MPQTRICNARPLALALLSLLLNGVATGQAKRRTSNPKIDDLRAGFLAPPASARLRCYWWWLNGNTDEITITHDLEEMKAKGFGGVLLVDANGANQNGNAPVPAGPTFGSPAWVKLYTHALKEADRLGLEVTLNITSGWNLGGPDVTPEQASKLLTWTRVQVKGGQRVQVRLPAPAQRNDFYRQIAVLAYPLQHGVDLAAQPSDKQGDHFTSGHAGNAQATDAQALHTLQFRSAAAETGFSMPDASAMLNAEVGGQSATRPQDADTALASVRDISSMVGPDGSLSWEAPPGTWEILRIGYTDSDARVSTSSGAWQGLAIDYLSRDAFETYWTRDVEPLLAEAKPYKSLRYLATDSWELGGTNWTSRFREEFSQRRGYDPVLWLPVIAGRIVDDRDQSTRFLTDLRRTVADLIVSEHYDVFAAKARAYGLGTQCESGGPHGAPIDALETFRSSAIPQTEFWSENAHRNKDPERYFTKEAASAAHIYGQPLVAQEGETSIGPQWSESLAMDLKPSFDMGVTEGLNRLVWHEFTSSPASTGLPGQEYFAGTHVNPKVTWWNAGGAFFTYLNRVQFLMQEGTPVDDLLYFYGDNVPNFVRLKADDPAHVLPGYDYDVTDEDALLHRIRVDGGQLSGLNGVTWKALALPKTGRLSLPVLELVERYVHAGGTVIGLAPNSPTGRVTPEGTTHFHDLVSKIWGADCTATEPHRYGTGQVFCTGDSHAVLTAMHVAPDALVADAGSSLQGAASTSGFDYVHRRNGSTDLYFVRNGSAQSSAVQVLFRADGRTPEFWDAVTGKTTEIPPFEKLPGGQVRVALTLPPFGSGFVVFRQGESMNTPTVPAVSTQFTAVTSLQPWTVLFQPGRGAPEHPVEVPGFTSWTEWPQPGVRYFSGTATYRAKVRAPEYTKGDEVFLTLSDVREIARIRLNGRDAGTIWAQPYKLKVSSLLHPGVNTLEVEVTNLWPNRIIGDLQPGVAKRFTQTNIRTYRADSSLLPSGLIGPVRWEIVPNRVHH